MAVEPLRRNRNRQEAKDTAQPQLIAQRVGDMLAEARERRGESIADVSRALRIRQPYLEALERGDHAALPGPTYAIGFVRAYAVHLDLDAAAAVRQFKEEAGSLELAADLNFPTPLPEGRIPTRGILVLALLLTGAAYVGWWFFSADGRRIADLIPALPGATVEAPVEETASAAPAPTPAPVTATAPTRAPEAEPPVAAAPAPEPATPAPASEPEPDATSAAAPEAATAAPAIAEAPGAGPTNDAASPDEPAPPTLAVEAAPVRPVPAVTQPAAPAPTSEPSGALNAPEAATAQALASASTPSSPPSGSAPSTATSAGASPTGTAPDDGAPATPSVALEPSEPSEPEAETATTAVAPEANRVFGEDNAGSRITVQATGDAWVEFRDGNGDLVFTRVLRPGDSYRVPDMPGLRLQTGNAGALVFQVDGTTLPPIGPSGSVRRNVLIEPDALRDGQAEAPPAEN